MPQNWSELADLATVLAAILTGAGVLFALRELYRNTRVHRAQFLLETVSQYFGDMKVRQLFYDINYNRFRISFLDGQPRTIHWGENESEEPFHGSEGERLLDQLLYTLDAIGRVVRLGGLRRGDAMLFAFQSARVLEKNEEIQKYLDWLEDQRRVHGGGEVPPFQAARELAALARQYRPEG
jgi:hypothetical protein